MRLRFLLICCVLALLGLMLLFASYAIAAPSGAPPPSWAWAAVVCCLAGLVGVCGWWVRRWIERRERWEELLISRMDQLDRRLDRLDTWSTLLIERVDTLPCREGRGNGIPASPSPLCSLRDKDVP